MSQDSTRGNSAFGFVRRLSWDRLRCVSLSVRRWIHTRCVLPLRQCDPFGFCFRCATVTGVLAILMMLGWQAFDALAGVGSKEGTASQVQNNELRRMGELQVKHPPAQREPEPVSVTIVDPDETVPAGTPSKSPGDAIIVQPKKTPTTSPFDSDAPSPFATEPLPVAGQPRLFASDPVGRPPVAAQKPQSDSPFLTRELPTLPQPVVGEPGRFEAPPLFEREAREQPPQRGPKKALVPRTVVSARPGNIVSVPGLELNIVRLPRPGAGRFLVTAVSGTKPATPSARSPISDDGPAGHRWSPIRIAKNNATILPAGHRIATTAGTSAEVRLSSSANARWQVVAPKLVVAMRSYALADKQVRIEFRVTNAGNAVAENVRLHIDLPPQLRYHVGRKLLHRVGRLDAGSTRTVRLTATIVRSGRVPVVAEALGGPKQASVRQVLSVGE